MKKFNEEMYTRLRGIELDIRSFKLRLEAGEELSDYESELLADLTSAQRDLAFEYLSKVLG